MKELITLDASVTPENSKPAATRMKELITLDASVTPESSKPAATEPAS